MEQAGKCKIEDKNIKRWAKETPKQCSRLSFNQKVKSSHNL